MQRVGSAQAPFACQRNSSIRDGFGHVHLQEVSPFPIQLSFENTKPVCVQFSCLLLPNQCRCRFHVPQTGARQDSLSVKQSVNPVTSRLLEIPLHPGAGIEVADRQRRSRTSSSLASSPSNRNRSTAPNRGGQCPGRRMPVTLFNPSQSGGLSRGKSSSSSVAIGRSWSSSS